MTGEMLAMKHKMQNGITAAGTDLGTDEQALGLVSLIGPSNAWSTWLCIIDKLGCGLGRPDEVTTALFG